eukprot:GFYU01000327.1.p1 GENE.GFYU01000327.1~~GFYU01000327.1.p1  ORF type:complete len:404 (+),score=106.71 GFYU01000327.1:326-1537(+)
MNPTAILTLRTTFTASVTKRLHTVLRTHARTISVTAKCPQGLRAHDDQIHFPPVPETTHVQTMTVDEVLAATPYLSRAPLDHVVIQSADESAREWKDIDGSGIMSPPHISLRQEPVVFGETREGLLTEERANHYNERGWVLVPGLFDAEEITAMKNKVHEVRETLPADDTRLVYEEGRPMVRSVFNVHRFVDMFSMLSREERILSVVSQILGEDVYVHQSRVNCQQGGVGNGFDWHSDFETWHYEDGMPRIRCLSAVVLMDDNYAFNGSLMIVPGSQNYFVGTYGETPADYWKTSLSMRDVQVGSTTNGDIAHFAQTRGMGIDVCEGTAGSVLFFDCNVLHGSNSNRTPFNRENVFFAYSGVSNRLGAPLDGIGRPEMIATRDAEWQQGLQQISSAEWRHKFV